MRSKERADMSLIIRILSFFLLIITVFTSYGTHIRAGEIIARRIDPTPGSYTYRFTFIGYRDVESGIEFGGGVFDFGDGNTVSGDEVSFTLVENLADNVVKEIFVVEHTYAAARDYLVSYEEQNRNAGISNMANSVNTKFYVETLIVIDPFIGNNSSPILTVPPIDEGAPGSRFIHNPGAFDPDGDSLSFVYEFRVGNETQIIIPKSSRDVEVTNYQELNDPQFYTNFPVASEDGNPPTLELDGSSGDLVWDAPGDIFQLMSADCPPGVEECSEYNIAFRVVEYRNINGVWERLGYVTRDMQITIWDGENEKPELSVPPDECVTAGETVNITVTGSDPDGDRVSLEAFGGPFEINSPATYTPFQQDSIIYQNQPGTLELEWNTVCGHVRERPYEVQFKVTDQPLLSDGRKRGPSLVEFETWEVTVVGPQPTGLEIEAETGRSIRLNWDQYTCSNASNMQIWRRVGDTNLQIGECDVGMPSIAGFRLIKLLPIDQLSTIDAGLAPGAKYCYRIVAQYPEPGGGESYVSEEVCITLDGDAPVITNVSIEETAEEGIVQVGWTPPLDIDATQFPPPYSYQVFRKLSSDSIGFDAISDVIGTTSYTDVAANTLEEVYDYRIVLYDAGSNFVDSSAIASSPVLDARSVIQAIDLSWDADVPWSNITALAPFHYIYRDNVFQNDPTRIALIDSVDVTENGLAYFDDGRFNNQNLDEDLEYCYYVTTYGSYDNEDIPSPLINNSQILCASPSDNEAPCPPVNLIVSNNFDCESAVAESGCSAVVFENEFEWEQEFEQDCDDDALYYRIYFSATGSDEDYILLDSTDQFSFVHGNLPSYKGCYKVSAVDRSLNESELSEALCIDNCPNYLLPNVFTPNADGYNDTFTPYFSNSTNPVEDFDNTNCPRFVNDVDFKVYDRNGVLVFDLDAQPEKSIYINWDGKNNNGRELPEGVYYYVAELQVDVLEVSDSKQTLNGWIQLLR